MQEWLTTNHLNEIFIVGSLWFWLLLIANFVLITGFIRLEKGLFATITFFLTVFALQIMGDSNVVGNLAGHPIWLAVGVVVYIAGAIFWGPFAKWTMFCVDRAERNQDVQTDWLRDLPNKAARLLSRIDTLKASTKSLENQEAESKIAATRGHGNTNETWYASKKKEVTDELEKITPEYTVYNANKTAKAMNKALWPWWEAFEKQYVEYDQLTNRNIGILTPEYSDWKARILMWMAYWPWSMGLTMLKDPITRLMKYLLSLFQETCGKIANHAFRKINAQRAQFTETAAIKEAEPVAVASGE